MWLINIKPRLIPKLHGRIWGRGRCRGWLRSILDSARFAMPCRRSLFSFIVYPRQLRERMAGNQVLNWVPFDIIFKVGVLCLCVSVSMCVCVCLFIVWIECIICRADNYLFGENLMDSIYHWSCELYSSNEALVIEMIMGLVRRLAFERRGFFFLKHPMEGK